MIPNFSREARNAGFSVPVQGRWAFAKTRRIVQKLAFSATSDTGDSIPFAAGSAVYASVLSCFPKANWASAYTGIVIENLEPHTVLARGPSEENEAE